MHQTPIPRDALNNTASVKKTELVIVMPVYNEAEIIETVLDDWIAVLDTLDCDYVVHAFNDGSTDDSLSILQGYAGRCTRLQVHDKANAGHGPTVLKGYKEFCDAAPWLFQVDSDNEVQAAMFPQFWEQRQGYDFIIGRRVGEQRPLIRRIMSTGAAMIVRLIFGEGVHDVNCPYRLMRAEVFRDLYRAIPDDTFSPNLVVAGYAAASSLRRLEIPVRYRTRKTGTVSIRKLKIIRAIVSSVIETIRLRGV